MSKVISPHKLVEELDPLFRPKSVAVIGASRSPRKVGNILIKLLLEYSYTGKIFPVNPNADEIIGLKTYPSLLKIPEQIDLAIIAVPAPLVLNAVKDCLEKGVRCILIITAGFSEVGLEGETLEQDLVKQSKGRARIVGPNSFGLINTDPEIRLNATWGARIKAPGTIAFLSQSGAFGEAVLAIAQERGIGFSKFVSLGNMCDVDIADLLMYLARDPLTKVIALYIEGVDDGRKLLEAAKEATRHKPIVCLKGGRSRTGIRAVSSHTGSMAGEDLIYDAAFKQSGIIRALDADEMLDMARALASQCAPRGRKVAIVSNSGGPAILTADFCEDYEVEFPSFSKEVSEKLRQELPPTATISNPLDIMGDATVERYEKVLPLVLGEREVQALILIIEGCDGVFIDNSRFPARIADVLRKACIPILVLWMYAEDTIKNGIETFEKAGFPVYRFPREAAQAMAALIRWRLNQDRGEKQNSA